MPTDPTDEYDDSLGAVRVMTDENRGAPTRALPGEEDDDSTSAADFLDAAGIQPEREVPDIMRPWMRYHDFVLVRTIEEVVRLVDEAIATGHTSLDLETEGLDNRIFYEEVSMGVDPVTGLDRKVRGKPYTKHKIVGFCLSPGNGHTGYYIPIRHMPTDGGPDLNVKPVERVEAEIRRLCLASQPIPKAPVKDPLAFREFEKPPQVVIDFWHASFDQEFLYPITGIDFWHPDSFEDGYLAAFVKYSGDKSLGLKGKSAELLKDPDGHAYEMIEIRELFPIRGQKIEFHRLSPDEPGVIRYGCSDGICTRLLCSIPDLVPFVKDKFGFTYRLEKQVAQVKRVMERHRVKINRARITELRDKHVAKRDSIEKKIVEFAESKGLHGFSPGSPKQLSDLLFTKEGLDITLSGRAPDDRDFPNGKPVFNPTTHQYKTGAEVLDELAKAMGDNAPPILKWIVHWREEDKVLGTYLHSMLQNLDERDELRFQFKQTGAATGRFSAPAGDPLHGYSGIPVHGIPATSDLRTCFMARPGYTMVKCDYAGEELRIVTNLSNERVWVKEFLEGSGDLHSITARAFFGKQDVSKDERKMGKIANFALVYGGGPAAVMRATGCDRMEGQRRKTAFDKAVPDFAKWVKTQHARVKKDLGVWTAFGRWIAIPDANSPDNAIRAACERHATNYPIQGSGADIMKIGMILIHKEMYRRGWIENDSVRMLLTVHDELVFEIRHDMVVDVIPVIVEMMEMPTRMARPPYSPAWQVPLVTEPLVGPTWGTGYPCERIKEGHTPGEGEVIVNGFVYGTIRTVDLGKELPGDGEIEHARDEKSKKLKIRMLHPEWLESVSGEIAAVKPSPKPPSSEGGSGGGGSDTLPPSMPPAEAPKAPVRNMSPKGVLKTATMRLRVLTKTTVEQVRALCAKHYDPDSETVLQLIDPVTNHVLIDPRLGVRVDLDKFKRSMLEQNLSDGRTVLS